jgi:hypothetical protein
MQRPINALMLFSKQKDPETCARFVIPLDLSRTQTSPRSLKNPALASSRLCLQKATGSSRVAAFSGYHESFAAPSSLPGPAQDE